MRMVSSVELDKDDDEFSTTDDLRSNRFSCGEPIQDLTVSNKQNFARRSI